MQGGSILLVLWLLLGLARADLPPIHAFFTERQALQMTISPDGKRWALLSQEPGRCSLRFGSLGNGGQEVVLDRGEESVVSFHWFTGGEGVIHVSTPTGREIRAVRFTGATGLEFRRLAALDPAERLIGIEDDGFLTRRRKNADVDEILLRGLKQKPPKRIADVPAQAEDVVASPNLALIHTFDPDGKALLWLANSERRRLLRTFGPDESVRIVRIGVDEQSAWILTNQGNSNGLTGLHQISLNDGHTVRQIVDSQGKGDANFCLFAPEEASPGYVKFAHPDSRSYWKASEWWEILHGVSGFTQWSPVSFAKADVPIAVFQAMDFGGRPHFVVVDCNRREVLHTVPQFPTLADIALGRSLSMSVPVEGFEIPTIVTLPPNWNDGKPAPTILFPHGGPFLHTVMGYDPRVQFLASRGYVVLQPNYRGSTGFGRQHQLAARRNWGPHGIQQDLDRVLERAVKAGYANPNAIGIFGGSFGGYLALSTACFRPDAYRCAAAFFAPSCMAELLLESPSGIVPSIGLLRFYFGDPRRDDERKALVRWSPRNATPRIPLMLYHGGRDSLIPVSHALEMMKQGGPSTLLLDPTGGHGFADTKTEIAAYTALEHFFARHLKGEQPDETPQVGTWKAEGKRALGNSP